MLSAVIMLNNLLLNLSVQQLRRAVALKEQIAALEAELGHIPGPRSGSLTTPVKHPQRRHKMSAAARARISAAQKARWAKQNGKPASRLGGKVRRKLSAKARAKLSALARARWARTKAAGKRTLAG